MDEKGDNALGMDDDTPEKEGGGNETLDQQPDDCWRGRNAGKVQGKGKGEDAVAA